MPDQEEIDNLANDYIERFGVIPTAASELAESDLVEEEDLLKQIEKKKRQLENIIRDQKQLIKAEKILNKKK